MNPVKKLFVLLPVFVLLVWSCAGTPEKTFSEPDWFLYRAAGGETGRLVGYGCGPTFEFARNMALGDIAEQVEVAVSTQTRLARSRDDESWSEEFHDAIRAFAKVTLGATTILMEEARGGFFYLALQYENPPPGGLLKQ